MASTPTDDPSERHDAEMESDVGDDGAETPPAASDDDPETPDLTPTETEALHEVELATEWTQRAHGHLLAFHHAVGHGMDHLDSAEPKLRESGHERLADRLRDNLLPRGVTDDDRWSYDIVEAFQTAFLADVTTFGQDAHDRLANGRRHVAERSQETLWRDRARDGK